MAQLLVRNLDTAVKEALRKRAARNGRSMEEEARDILRRAASETTAGAVPLGTRIAGRFRDGGLVAPIEELRGTRARAATFR
jgi:plasmid stability protein